MKWGHNELAHDLAEHLRQNTARPDVYALPHSYSKFCPVVYEIKVSVSDFRTDVTAGKYTKYFKYASAVVFAVPEGMLKKTDIPEGCGLMIRKETGWHTLKGPTIRPLDNIPRDAWIKLVMDGVKREGDRTRIAARTTSTYYIEERLRKRLGGDIASLVAQAHQSNERLKNAIEHQEKQRQAVVRQTDEESRQRREDRERREERLNKEQSELAVTLGLAPDATIYQLIRAIQTASNRLAEDSEIQRLRRIFGDIERMISNGQEALPGENAA